MCRALLWEQKGELEAQLPVGTEVRLLDVVVSLEEGVDRLFADLVHPANSATERHRPLLPTLRLPVGGDDGLGGQKLALVHVVVGEDLAEEEVDVGVAVERPDVGQQDTRDPRA